MNATNNTVNLLWTGGWDSTFQLMKLVFDGIQSIHPHYLIDEDRKSTRLELMTMRNIRAAISRIDPSSSHRILPAKLAAVNDVPACASISDAFGRIKEKSFIGSKYDWLARFCSGFDVRDLQLCVHRDDRAAKVIENFIVRRDSGVRCVPRPTGGAGVDEYLVFGWFEFPVFYITKREMLEISFKRGWMPVMQLTWFCHAPRTGKPCGRCNPCVYTAQEGLSWRIPMSRRILGRVYNGSIKPVKEFFRSKARLVLRR